MDLQAEEYMAGFFPKWKAWKEEFPQWRVKSRKPDGNTVVCIPARSGSTRIKDKNISLLCGKPLLAYTIEVARALKGVDRIIVSTDSAKYKSIAEEYGAESPVLRPRELSRATSPYKHTYQHLLFTLASSGYQTSTIITLVPTNPFRNLARLQEMVDATKQYGEAQTVFRPVVSPDFEESLGDKIPFKNTGLFSGRHVSICNFKSKKLYFITNPFELIDIDTHEDLAMAEFILERGLYDFGRAQ